MNSATFRACAAAGSSDIAATTVSGPPGVAARTAYTATSDAARKAGWVSTARWLLRPGGSRYIGGLAAEAGSPVTTRFLASSTWIRGTPADTGMGIGSGTCCDDSSLAATWLAAPVTEPQTESVSDPW